MDYHCYKCGARIEEGTAFCPHCNAPQIRVPEALALSPSSVGIDFPVSVESPLDIDWSHGITAAAFSSVLSGLLMIFPLGGVGLGMIAGGTLCVALYRRRVPLSNPTPRMGAKLGAASGMLAFVLFSILTAVQVLVFHMGDQLRANVYQSIEQAAARTSDPQAKPFIDYLHTTAGLELVMAMGFAVMLALFLILSSIGGALGAALLRRKRLT